jgi:hypothetical protein
VEEKSDSLILERASKRVHVDVATYRIWYGLLYGHLNDLRLRNYIMATLYIYMFSYVLAQVHKLNTHDFNSYERYNREKERNKKKFARMILTSSRDIGLVRLADG